jgi:hypothetical protein
MTALHPFHSHHRLHYYTLRYLLPLLLALVLFFLLASPVRGQVMIDANQLHGQLPSWVDPAYAKPAIAPESPVIIVERPYPPIERVWVPAITQTIHERVWVADRYEYRLVMRCAGDHMVWVRELVLAEPGHFEVRCREIVIVPGHWEAGGSF